MDMHSIKTTIKHMGKWVGWDVETGEILAYSKTLGNNQADGGLIKILEETGKDYRFHKVKPSNIYSATKEEWDDYFISRDIKPLPYPERLE